VSYHPQRSYRSAQLSIQGLRHQVYCWEGRGTPIVFLHGWGDSGLTFQFVIDCLQVDRACVALDWRGFGRTERAPGAYWFPDYLADLDAFLHEISPNEAVDIVSHSMGGNVAMLYAGVRPERVRRLVNLEGFGLPPSEAKDAPTHYGKWLGVVRHRSPHM
jgi:pimeloyl-ACP methyl ester carboxylesterase